MPAKKHLLAKVALLLVILSSAASTQAMASPAADNAMAQGVSRGGLIDNIPCEGGHDNDYHVHDAIFVYIDGAQILLPGALGQVPQASCLYWLHTHADSSLWGIVHIEAPLQYNALLGLYVPPNFTLQQFWDVWLQTSPRYIPQVSGTWNVYVDGQAVYGPFSAISLNPDGQGHHVVVMASNTDTSTLYFPDANGINWHGF